MYSGEFYLKVSFESSSDKNFKDPFEDEFSIQMKIEF